MPAAERPRTVFINGRFLTQSISGVQRVARELIAALDALLNENAIDPKQVSFTVLCPRGSKPLNGLKHIRVRTVGRLHGHAWEQIELPFYSRGGLLVNLGNTGPILRIHQLVLVHDASVFALPGAYTPLFVAWYRLVLTLLSRIARKLLTVSNFSRLELQRYLGVAEGRFSVIGEGAEQILAQASDPSVLDRNGLAQMQYVLAVSSANPNKNFRAIAEAVALLRDIDFELVIAGGANPAVFAPSTPLPSTVRYVGFVSDPELRALYERAACFVFPSFYEGFGLPPLEAMACGCPVIVANTSAMPEVCGDAALYCDPHRPDTIAAQIRAFLDDPRLRDEYRVRGYRRAASFGWRKSALALWKEASALL